MGVYEDLLAWSRDRPLWQRDALRRLTEAELGDDDVRELADMAIAASRGDAVEGAVPLDATHLPVSAIGGSVRLGALAHIGNVNALAPGEEIEFGRDGLTVVYGDNASGKSGYVRVLKKLCRARAAGGPIRPNVFRPVQGTPAARIRFFIGDEPRDAEWSPAIASPPGLASVSVFDRDCASLYVTAENEVAYRPFGLDLLDRLAATAERVRGDIDRRRRDRGRTLVDIPPEVYTTQAYAPRFPLRPASDPEAILAAENWTSEDDGDLARIERALGTDSPSARAASLSAVRNGRARLLQLLQARGNDLSLEMLEALHRGREERRSLEEARNALTTQAFSEAPGVGSEPWRHLWDAARRWSEEEVYPGHSFPFLGAGARCVLCGQELSSEAAERLTRFRDFVISDVTTRVDAAIAAVGDMEAPLEGVLAGSADDAALIADFAPEAPEVTQAAVEFLRACRERAQAALSAEEESEWAAIRELPQLPAVQLADEIDALDREIDVLRQASVPESIEPIRERHKTLLARRWLVQNGPAIRAETERLKEMSILNEAAASCTTNAITTESTRLTERYVTLELAQSFESELEVLRATRVPVRVSRRGERGAVYHRIELRDVSVPGVRVQEVVSEGEFGAVALAAFLAETVHGGDASAVVLDDPVSSFDHLHRRSAARRLATEAAERQVIIFTHDLVFLANLESAAEELRVPLTVLNLKVRAEGVGVPEAGPPWAAQKVPARIGLLQDQLAAARRAFESGDLENYEGRARNWYGSLRETWERAVEEILFGEVVVRYRHGVETMRATRQKIWLIEEEDVRTLEAAMTKASGQIRGHDQPGAVNDPVPRPDELVADLNVLRAWVESFRARRRA